jgi:RimJ/RimL family protein N-acetyltransferase
MPSAVELRGGDDLLLRPWQDGDAEAIGITLRDAVMGRYLGEPFGGFLPPDPDAPWFAIVEHAKPVGRIWFAAHRRPFEVGYFLHPDAWGRGLATRSLRLVAEWMEVPMELYTHPANERSQRVAERAGFRRDGEDEQYARFKDGTTRALRFVFP